MSISPNLQLTEEQKALITDLKTAAAAPENVVDIQKIGELIKTPEGLGRHMAHMTSQTITINQLVVTYSIESGHPLGLARHISFSEDGDRPTLASSWLFGEIMVAFGFARPYEKVTNHWLETFKNRGRALNIVQEL